MDILTQLFTTELGRRLGLGLCIVTGLLLLVTVVDTFSTWQDDFILTRKARVKAAGHGEITNDINKLIASIPAQHLFGQHPKARSEILPITSLQLRLLGVIKANPESRSSVIISERGGPGKVYQIGDSLPSGVRVYAITPDGVILDNSGQLEKLLLERSKLSFQGMPKSMNEQK